MALSGIGPANRDTRSEWIRLRTLVLLRWMAIVGQLAALTVADRVVGMQLPLGLCYLVVGAAVIGNLVASFVFPGNKRFSEAGAMLTLLFDVSQLAILLALTGGLNNPFALLILVPVTISAGALELRTTVLLGLAAICLISVISVYNLPLRFSDGTILQVPAVFEFGFWLSIVIGIMFLALYSRRVATEIRSMSDALLATQMALAREQKLTDLGGVVAAAAHELGTPLATIKLASTELVEELADRPDLREDAELIRTQADRCRDILRSMGRAGKDDLHLRQAPLGAVLREAAEPHLGRGKTVAFDVFPGTNGGDRQPTILRRPEVIHGLRNLVQNAVDFARARVWIDATWTDSFISVRIIDDGAGYPSYILGRIGDPFVRSRPAAQETGQRPDYEGMGLGLFIAKTLLERSGAEISFANGTDPFLTRAEHPDRFGAIVEVRWPKSVIVAPETDALGPNRPLDG
ncbi:MAG: ActS/PrrB/RegB family redox-sensitive histidine kinase [Rhodobacter sp.]|nr:ActS/PrrB/RegB family redox-sensitive histidine kinase [Rhodobacter sp.]MCA3457192.1 ActS/PrrB/RegB family redox-sensitive histidine kinase [Rhodobacter sp.]MCA3460214.1 ActS/PrrB/RegB family redox-sensitive histidine kinase [Rhodobacter sp.]MCA3463398.1 ActS/PrrB/RegB family redox-sensitive histidine kinase [Rhodobacter sp.]MCA3466643.1 ActS/PrrB/RegB family redox-sensitive histidine kinase [Rhodobacter sp.]